MAGPFSPHGLLPTAKAATVQRACEKKALLDIDVGDDWYSIAQDRKAW